MLRYPVCFCFCTSLETSWDSSEWFLSSAISLNADVILSVNVCLKIVDCFSPYFSLSKLSKSDRRCEWTKNKNSFLEKIDRIHKYFALKTYLHLREIDGILHALVLQSEVFYWQHHYLRVYCEIANVVVIDVQTIIGENLAFDLQVLLR